MELQESTKPSTPYTFRDVTDEHLLIIMNAFDVYKNSTRLISDKKEALARELPKPLPEPLQWLFAFMLWACRSKVLPVIDPTKYAMIPYGRKTEDKTFQDFVQLLHYLRLNSAPKQWDKELIKFYHSCPPNAREFYATLLEREQPFRVFVAHCADAGYGGGYRVESEDIILDNLLILDSGKRLLQYPTWLLGVDDIHDLPFAILYRTTRRQFIRIAVFVPSRLAPLRIVRQTLFYTWFRNLRGLKSNEFVLFGQIDVIKGRFYALDYFVSLQEYRRARKGRCKTPPEVRWRLLREMEEANLHCQLEVPPRVFCKAEVNLPEQLAYLLKRTDATRIMFLDQRIRTASTVIPHRKGIIQSPWFDSQGILRGFNVWNNGELIQCEYMFDGKMKALTFNPGGANKVPVCYTKLTFNGMNVNIVREIRWETQPFASRTRKTLDGRDILLDKCLLCLDDDYPHETQGYCKNCYGILRGRLRYGTHGEWYSPPKANKNIKETGDWNPDLINSCDVFFRGHKIISKPDVPELTIKLIETEESREQKERARKLKEVGEETLRNKKPKKGKKKRVSKKVSGN